MKNKAAKAATATGAVEDVADEQTSDTEQVPEFNVSSPAILNELFTAKNIRRTIRRMRAAGDNENEVYHPLRKIILLEYEQALSESLAASVPAGAWTPSSSYIVLVAKRSGTYREMAFPAWSIPSLDGAS